MKRTIVVLESDYSWMESTTDFLQRYFARWSIRSFSTEAEFRAAFSDIVADPPALMIMEARVRWTDSAPDMPKPPEDVRLGTFREAGLRCLRMVRQNPRTKEVPVILYSIANDKPEATASDPLASFIPKESDDRRLQEEIRRLLC